MLIITYPGLYFKGFSSIYGIMLLTCGHISAMIILRARVDISKQMLSDRNVSIKEAAFSCGFSDEKYYMRVFRKMEGMTPAQYRAAIGVK